MIQSPISSDNCSVKNAEQTEQHKQQYFSTKIGGWWKEAIPKPTNK